MDFILKWINRFWFCRREGHIWDYSNSIPDSIGGQFQFYHVRCTACDIRAVVFDLEARIKESEK